MELIYNIFGVIAMLLMTTFFILLGYFFFKMMNDCPGTPCRRCKDYGHGLPNKK